LDALFAPHIPLPGPQGMALRPACGWRGAVPRFRGPESMYVRLGASRAGRWPMRLMPAIFDETRPRDSFAFALGNRQSVFHFRGDSF